MIYRNKIVSIFLLLTVALIGFSCKTQTAQVSNNEVKAQSPTEAYKMLFAAVKSKDTSKIKQMMTQSTVAFGQMNADRQKISLEKSLENGLVAPTMSDQITAIRDERVKGDNGAIEVFNQKENKWEDLPFMLENGGWKLAIGDLFQAKYESPGKGQAQLQMEATNKMTMPEPSKGMKNFPNLPANTNSMTIPGNVTLGKPTNSANESRSKTVEVPKEEPPKK